MERPMSRRKDRRPTRNLACHRPDPSCLEVCEPLVDPSLGTSVKLHTNDLVAGLVRAYTLTSATPRALPAVPGRESRESRNGARK